MTKTHRVQRYKDLASIEARIKSDLPAPGDYLYDYRIEPLKEKYSKLDAEELARKLLLNFVDLPISESTVKSLHRAKFFKLTEVQRCVIPQFLAGRDILAASKTGSGKTLAYLIPIIENLYRHKWTAIDGLGAIVMVPTRELALQVFEVLRVASNHHELNIGLVIGGKNVEFEKQSIPRMNIIVCTPGRLLQHMNETSLFDYSNLKMLVIDEADELLSMGFNKTLSAILTELPKKRQTVLLSATLGKDVLKLAKLALKMPERIYLNEVKSDAGSLDHLQLKAADLYETPKSLKQYYMVVNHEEKVDVLFSFLKSHQRSKILVFMNSCKQVRFIYSAFKKLKPGLPISELHGRQKQSKRMAIYFTFSERKYSCLFTTNLGARGLDFPSVDWVVLLDCPDNMEDYIHKVGRTARFTSSGKSLLILAGSEASFADTLKENQQHTHKLNPNPERQLTIKKSLEALCSEDQELKYLAQRAIISYIKSIYYKQDKNIFNLKDIKLKKLAKSYGLIQTPQISFGMDDDDEENATVAHSSQKEPSVKGNKKLQKLKEKIKNKKLANLENSTEIGYVPDFEGDENALKKNVLHNTKRFKERPKKSSNLLSDDDEEEDSTFLKKRLIPRDIDAIESEKWKLSKRQQEKKVNLEGHFGGRNVFIIPKEGKPISKFEYESKQSRTSSNQIVDEDLNLVGVYASKLKDTEIEDKIIAEKRIQEKKKKKKSEKKIIEEIRKNAA